MITLLLLGSFQVMESVGDRIKEVMHAHGGADLSKKSMAELAQIVRQIPVRPEPTPGSSFMTCQPSSGSRTLACPY